jgi:two-component system OmpR family response regulator
MRVLVVEDEPKMAGLLRRGLEESGFVVDTTDRGEDALWMATSSSYDAILLDVMLPGIDGYETCRRLREAEVWSPVLMLTARGEIEDRVAGLDGGADDYLVKPFAFPELTARVRAVARRGATERRTVLQVGDLRMDLAGRRVWRGDAEIELSATELSLLEAFMRRPGHVLTRLDLLEAGWNMDYDNKSNVIAVYVGYLRNKIDRPFGREDLETVRGAGYRLRAG